MRKLIAIGLLCISGLLTAGLVAYSAYAPLVPIEELAASSTEIAMFAGALLTCMALAAVGVTMLISDSERQRIAPDIEYPYALWVDDDDGGPLQMREEPGHPVFMGRRRRGHPAPA